MLRKSYLVSGQTYLPPTTSQLHYMSKGADEVLGTILVAVCQFSL